MSSIRQAISFAAPAAQVYSALTQAEVFARFTGKPANISSEAGGEFSGFDGMITGRHIELVPNQRVVQAWRVGTWPDGVFSLVRFELSVTDNGPSQLMLNQVGYPEEARDHLQTGWHQMYWEPLKAYLSKPL